MTERRMTRRYELSLPVSVRVPIAGDTRPQQGQTRDISTRGVYFTTQTELAPGMELDFTLTLPADFTQGIEVSMRAHGRVIRVDKDHGLASPMGVAATVERFDIVRSRESSDLIGQQ